MQFKVPSPDLKNGLLSFKEYCPYKLQEKKALLNCKNYDREQQILQSI